MDTTAITAGNTPRFTRAVVMHAPGQVGIDQLALRSLDEGDVLVRVKQSGISSGTERMLWSGTMPFFPGLSYPLVPGYEALGVVEAIGSDAAVVVGDTVFVPGARCHEGAAGLFGASSQYLVSPANRVFPVRGTWTKDATLVALAATAFRAVHASEQLPELIVGHGVVGRLIARLVTALGGSRPTVWETNARRQSGAVDYDVTHPKDDDRTDYTVVCDASGDNAILDQLIARTAKGGEVVLAGFYGERLSFGFPAAFMREVSLRIAAEFTPADARAVIKLIDSGTLNLDGLVTHRMPATAAANAYNTAFGDPECLKMVLDWSDS